MLVTKISEQVKNADRASIFVDGKYSFSLTIDQLLETKLKVGTEVDEARLKELVKLSEIGKLKMRTLEWLMLRPRSAKELADYLKRKKVNEEEAAQVIAYFQKHSYQNDEQFAKWWADQRRAKQKSSQFIKYELKTKGVNDEIISQILSTDTSADQASLKELIIKKRRQTKYQDNKKLTEYLVRQGYRYSLVKDALAE